MKYKVGDKVRIRSKEWYDKHKDERGEIVGAFFDKDRAKLCGTIQTIANNGFIDGLGVTIYAVEDAYEFIGEEAIEGLAEDETKPKYEDEVNGEYYSTPKYLVRPSGYQFIDENGNVINATKIVLEKKKKEYPKTFRKCCEMLDIDSGCLLASYDIGLWKDELLGSLQKLLICRDAYWKIAGEEMGLDKPWKPDWNDKKQDKHVFYHEIKHTIISSTLFVFPTAEMRDAFYENFKKLINECKKLL